MSTEVGGDICGGWLKGLVQMRREGKGEGWDKPVTFTRERENRVRNNRDRLKVLVGCVFRDLSLIWVCLIHNFLHMRPNYFPHTY